MKSTNILIVAMWVVSMALAIFFGYMFFSSAGRTSELQNANASLQSQLDQQDHVLGLTKAAFSDLGLGVKLVYPSDWKVLSYQTETSASTNSTDINLQRYSISLTKGDANLVFSKSFNTVIPISTPVENAPEYHPLSEVIARYKTTGSDTWQYGTIVVCAGLPADSTKGCVNDVINGFSTSGKSDARAFVQTSDSNLLGEADNIVLEATTN